MITEQGQIIKVKSSLLSEEEIAILARAMQHAFEFNPEINIMAKTVGQEGIINCLRAISEAGLGFSPRMEEIENKKREVMHGMILHLVKK